MTATFRRQDGLLIARAVGSTLDVGTAGPFKQALIAALGESGLSIIVDLSEVAEIDSSGIGALVAVLKGARRFGGSARLCGARPHVREVLELTMLHRVLPLHESLEEALLAETGAESAG